MDGFVPCRILGSGPLAVGLGKWLCWCPIGVLGSGQLDVGQGKWLG